MLKLISQSIMISIILHKALLQGKKHFVESNDTNDNLEQFQQAVTETDRLIQQQIQILSKISSYIAQMTPESNEVIFEIQKELMKQEESIKDIMLVAEREFEVKSQMYDIGDYLIKDESEGNPQMYDIGDHSIKDEYEEENSESNEMYANDNHSFKNEYDGYHSVENTPINVDSLENQSEFI